MAKSPAKLNVADTFNELFKAPPGERAAAGLKLIDRGRIHIQGQPRKSFPPAEQDELTASIRELRARGEGIEGTGILQPLVVTPADGGYRLIAGERRLRAAGQAEIDEVPAIVIQTHAENLYLLQIIENLQRQNLRPIEEAQAIQELIAQQDLSLRTAATLLGKNKGYIENRLNLLRMGDDLQELVSVRTDTLQHARLIEPVKDEPLRAKLIQATREGASEREIRQLIDISKKGPSTDPPIGKQTGDLTGKQTGVSVRTDTSSQSRSTAPPDPIADAIRPGVAHLAEGLRLLEEGKIDARLRKSLQSEIKTAETIFNRLKQLTIQ